MSVLVNNLRPDNLFKFINIRASYRADDDKKALFFVQDIYTIGNSLDLKGDKKALSSLYPNLEALIGTPDQLKKHIAILVEYKTTKYYIKKADEYNILFPQLTEFIAWMDCHASTTSFKEIQEKFGQIFKKTPQEYFASLEPKIGQLIFWNNLLVNLFSTDDAFLVTLSCKYLAGLHIVQVIAENDKKALEQYTSKIVSIYHAKPLVPKWIFNLLTSINLKSDTGVGDRLVSKDKEDNQKKYNALTTAIKEVRNFVVSKEDTLKYQVEDLENKIDDITRFVSAKDFDRYAEYIAIENSFGAFRLPPILNVIIHEFKVNSDSFLPFADGETPEGNMTDTHIPDNYTKDTWDKANDNGFGSIQKNQDFVDHLYQSHRAYASIALAIIISKISN